MRLMMGLLFFVRFRAEHHDDHGCCYNGDCCGKLDAGENLTNIYHVCKYRSIKIAIIVLNIQNSVLYVKLLTLLDKEAQPTKQKQNRTE